LDTRTTLTVTAKDQVTLKRSLLERLGVRPGDQITVDICMPDGAMIRAVPRAGIEGFFGCLPKRPIRVHRRHEQDLADGWAGQQDEDHA
jgi:antitoxin PrlF